MTITPALFIAAGEVLYGDQWVTRLGRALAWHRDNGKLLGGNAMYDWKAGRKPIPEWVAEGVHTLLDERMDRGQEVLRDLEKAP